MKKIQNFIPKKILVLQQRQLGDVIVTTPVFSVLRKHFPDAHIALFTEDKCYPLIAHDPNINSFEICNKSHLQNPFQKFWSQCKTYWKIRQAKYDIIIDLQQLPRCQMVTLFSGAKYKVTFTPRHEYRKLLYTHYDVPENFNDYISYGKTSFLKPLGIEATYEKPRLYLKQEEIDYARTILNQVGIYEYTPFITMDATHKHPFRRFQHYDSFIEKFLATYPDYKILLLRAKGEETQLQKLINIDTTRVCMPTIAPSLRESMACMHHASFHVGNTSAPAHMALALNIPALIILANTAKLWHFDPINPPKGTAKQKEVRVNPQKFMQYKSDLQKHKQAPKAMAQNPFSVLAHPEMELITAEEAFIAFQALFQAPYYK